MKNQELVEALKSLSFNELLKTIYAALEDKNERTVDPETGLPDNDLFLLTETFYDEGEVEFRFCAIGNSLESTPELPGHSGRCRTCKARLTSSCKVATCPVCGSPGQELT